MKKRRINFYFQSFYLLRVVCNFKENFSSSRRPAPLLLFMISMYSDVDDKCILIYSGFNALTSHFDFTETVTELNVRTSMFPADLALMIIFKDLNRRFPGKRV